MGMNVVSKTDPKRSLDQPMRFLFFTPSIIHPLGTADFVTHPSFVLSYQFISISLHELCSDHWHLICWCSVLFDIFCRWLGSLVRFGIRGPEKHSIEIRLLDTGYFVVNNTSATLRSDFPSYCDNLVSARPWNTRSLYAYIYIYIYNSYLKKKINPLGSILSQNDFVTCTWKDK